MARSTDSNLTILETMRILLILLLALTFTDSFVVHQVHVHSTIKRIGSKCGVQTFMVAADQNVLGTTGEGRPSCFVVLSNLQSGTNIGRITRNALAFGASEVIIVGKRDVSMHHGDKGAQRRQTFVHFYTMAEAARYLKEDRGATILGVEITDDAVPVHLDPFAERTAFLFGNEALGLSVRRPPSPSAQSSL
jgi:tRNA G18 (ribose-2'-O)-methylase SpoU